MRVVESCSTALSRQIGEAIRIRRRGGEGRVLNSRAEYKRSQIPRLQLEEETKTKMREEEQEKEELRKSKQLEEGQLLWEQDKTKRRDRESKQLAGEWRSSTNKKEGGAKRPKGREQLGEKGEKKERANKKKMRYALLGEDWGTAPMEEEGSQLTGRRGEETLRREEGSCLDQGGGIGDERELTLPPSSLGVEEVGGRVVTPTEFPQFRVVGAMTQRRIFEFLTPVRCAEQPRADILQASPPLEVKNRGETINRPRREDIVRWTGAGGEDSVKEAALEEVPEANHHPDTENDPDTIHLTAPSVGGEVEPALLESSRAPALQLGELTMIEDRGQACTKMMSDDIGLSVREDDDQGGVSALKNDDDKMLSQGDRAETCEVTDGDIICSFKRGICGVHNLKGKN